MKKLFWIGLLASILAPASASAQSPFDGTWKTNVANATLPKKPDVYLLQGGVFDCQSCIPPYQVTTDGQDHSVSGDPYFDSASVDVWNDWTVVVTAKKNGKVVGTTKFTVSMDANTLTLEWSYVSTANGQTVSGKQKYARVTKGPEGAHAISGSWRLGEIETMSENGLLFTLKVNGDSLTMSDPTGDGYTAKLDGTEAPYHGDPGTTTVSVKQIDRNTIEETDKRDGKVINVTRMTVSADGKSMMLSVDDKLNRTTSQYEADKQ